MGKVFDKITHRSCTGSFDILNIFVPSLRNVFVYNRIRLKVEMLQLRKFVPKDQYHLILFQPIDIYRF